MKIQPGLELLERINRPSVAVAVFAELNRQIMNFDLPPGTKMSEMDVARALRVSRQPVRDTFYRLSKLGFLTIRPERATRVSVIIERAVMEARFIRMAIEVETARVACERLTSADHEALDLVLSQQEAAVKARDAVAFHDLHEKFHRETCERTGRGFTWDVIRENKFHMDRVRSLSLSFAPEKASVQHVTILASIRARDATRTAEMVRQHLSRILDQIVRIRAEHKHYFGLEN